MVENEDGEIVRETLKDSENMALYKSMRETLVYLTHLNYEDTENIMLDKLSNQVNGTEWSCGSVTTTPDRSSSSCGWRRLSASALRGAVSSLLPEPRGRSSGGARAVALWR